MKEDNSRGRVTLGFELEELKPSTPYGFFQAATDAFA